MFNKDKTICSSTVVHFEPDLCIVWYNWPQYGSLREEPVYHIRAWLLAVIYCNHV